MAASRLVRLLWHENQGSGRVPNESPAVWLHGALSEVRAEVRHCIDALASDGTGYILAPCHNLQVNTPVENIIAMYDEAWHYGKRS
jgi:uroporphyrinogen-III decarboxylase